MDNGVSWILEQSLMDLVEQSLILFDFGHFFARTEGFSCDYEKTWCRMS